MKHIILIEWTSQLKTVSCRIYSQYHVLQFKQNSHNFCFFLQNATFPTHKTGGWVHKTHQTDNSAHAQLQSTTSKYPETWSCVHKRLFCAWTSNLYNTSLSFLKVVKNFPSPPTLQTNTNDEQNKLQICQHCNNRSLKSEWEIDDWEMTQN